MCLLHANELPLRHVFATLDGSTSGPNTFTGPIGKCLHGPASTWSVGQFEQIAMPTPSFPKLPTHVVDDLSTDQHYANRICGAIINGAIEDDLVYLEVGPIVH